jgi:hypothetical protein
VSLPLVSCVCPTYGRAPAHLHLLAEAVESFLRQDYAAKELLVLNDCPGQVLVCDAPGVRVVNLPHRCTSLGAKYNLAVGLVAGELVAPWEDDDISLPHRLHQAVERIGGAHYWNPQRTWYLVSGELRRDHSHGVCHNASIYRKSAWLAAGMYPPLSGAQDAHMDGRLKALGPCPAPLGDDPAEWQYVYRWGVSPSHLSGASDPEAFYRAHAAAPAAPGRYVIEPAWREDYGARYVAASGW